MKQIAWLYAAPPARGRTQHGVRFRIGPELLYSPLLRRDLIESGLLAPHAPEGLGTADEVERQTEALYGNFQYAVVGVALLSFHGLTVGTSAYDPLQSPLQGEACLEQFWSKFWRVEDSDSQTSFQQGFFRIKIEKGHLLPEPQQVRAQTGELDGVPRGSVFELTSPSAIKIHSLTPQDWKGIMEFDELPNLAIRVPLPHALLLACGRWECYSLPLVAGRREGLEYLKRRWKHLFKELRGRRLVPTDSRSCQPTTDSAAAGGWWDR